MLDKDKLAPLRTAVKNECARRNGYGSLTGTDPKMPEDYTSSEYNVPTPTSGELVKVCHGKGIIDPLVAINDYGDLKKVEKGRAVPDSFNDNLLTYVNTLAMEAKGDTLKTTETLDAPPVSSCRGACTGLCAGTCIGGCSGCHDECTGKCSSSCNTGCSGCSATCGTGCADGCMVSKA